MTVIGVLGGSGGVGASTFAAALALAAGESVLIDCDPFGGGVDVVLGIETEPGARWRDLRVGGGRLDPRLLAEGLPRWRGVAVLGAEGQLAPDAVTQVVRAATALGPVVLDVPRVPGAPRDAALDLCGFCVLVAATRPAALVAGLSVIDTLPGGLPVGVVLRRPSRPRDLALVDATRALGVPLLGTLPPLDGGDVGGDPPRAVLRVAAGVLDGALTGATR